MIAAASVVVTHAFWLTTADDAQQPLSALGHKNLGHHAVNVFFVLSGILVAGSLDRSKSMKSFVASRALRILPGLLACTLFTAFVVGPLVSSTSLGSYFSDARTWLYPIQVTAMAKISAGLPGVFATNPVPNVVNESLWTLKYEVLCYTVLTLLAVCGALRSTRPFVGVLVLSALILVRITFRPADPTNLSPIDHFARFWLLFLLGVAFHHFRATIPLRWSLLAAAVLVWWAGSATRFEPVLTFLATGYGAIMLASLPGGWARDFANQHDLSYGIYIYGWPVTQALVWFRPGITSLAAAALSLLLAAVLAWASWTLVERPSLDLKKRLSRASWRRSEPSSVVGVST
nr:acyltransferase [Enterovirga sp. DB1703]